MKSRKLRHKLLLAVERERLLCKRIKVEQARILYIQFGFALCVLCASACYVFIYLPNAKGINESVELLKVTPILLSSALGIYLLKLYQKHDQLRKDYLRSVREWTKLEMNIMASKSKKELKEVINKFDQWSRFNNLFRKSKSGEQAPPKE